MQLYSRADRFFTPRIVLVLGWCWFLLYAYPGFMTPESIAQLYQARGHQPINDWQPPMTVFLWHYVDNVFAGPFGMLAIQSIAFLLGTYFVLVRFMQRRAAAICAVLLLVVPYNIIVISVVWKDALLPGLLVAAVAAFLGRSLRWRLVGCLLVFGATAVRYNAFAATLPIILLLWDLDLARAWYKRHAAALGVWAAITATAFGANAVLTKQGTQPLESGDAPKDIAGILKRAPDVDIELLERETPDVPWKNGGNGALFDPPTSASQADALGALRWRLVREHPGAFVRHRLALWNARLDCRVSTFHSFIIKSAEPILQHRSTYSPIQKAWIRANQKIMSIRAFRPRMFFLLSLVLLVFARRNRLALALLLSGIANELALLVGGTSVSYQDSHWMVACTILATVLLVHERTVSGSSARRALPADRQPRTSPPRA